MIAALFWIAGWQFTDALTGKESWGVKWPVTLGKYVRDKLQ